MKSGENAILEDFYVCHPSVCCAIFFNMPSDPPPPIFLFCGSKKVKSKVVQNDGRHFFDRRPLTLFWGIDGLLPKREVGLTQK